MAGCIAGCATHRPAPVSFPGDSRQTSAPDSRGAIVNVDREEPDAQGNSHILYFRTPSGSFIPILSYPRHVEILWSPSGDTAAISDAWASDDAICLVFDTTTRQLTDTTPQLEATLPWLADLRRRGHCTISALGWNCQGELEVRIDGYAPGVPEVNNLIARVRVAGSLGR
jgi:hypothetical protein